MKNIINIPKNDMNKYAYNILSNNIKYAMVQDNNIDMSSVCVTVKAGSIQEPVEYQGLAHFLEHMLFLGSKKYPKEDYFDARLKSCGGYSNAWTDTFETVYYFTVQTEYLEEMIDIFSRFFIDPLFDPDCVDREMNAVNSEHKKNINNDWWRIYRMLDVISKKDSQLNKFGTGNLETLNKKGVRDRMIKFYNDYYCSENISVASISSISLEKQNKIIEKYFKQIKNKKSKIFKIQQPFYHSKNDSYHILSISKMKTLIFLWEIPTFHHDIEYKSWNIIKNYINDNGLKSLESFLKSKELIEDLYIFPRNEGQFLLMIDLLKNNLKTRQTVTNYVNYFIKDLLNKDWDKISKYFQKNIKLLFHNGSRKDPLKKIQDLAINCHYSKKMENIAAEQLITKIDSNRIKKLLNKYLDTNYIQIYVSNKKEKIKYKKEKYYGTNYGVINHLDNKEKQIETFFNFDNPYQNISPKNIKISKNLEIPSKGNNIWYGATSKFKEPKIYSLLKFTSYDYVNTPKKFLINTLIVKSIEYYLSRKFNQENALGYLCSISLTTGSLIFNITGFNDKFKLFFNSLFDFIKELKLESYIIKSFIKETKDNILNSEKVPSWEYTDILVAEYTNKYDYTKDELLTELKKIKVKEVIVSKNDILKGNLTPFFYGNLEKKDIPDLTIFKKFINRKLPKLLNLKKIKSMKVKHPYKKENNNCVSIYFPCGDDNYNNLTKLFLLKVIIDQPFFNKLRTKDQLGYRVRFYNTKFNDDQYLVAKVQSEKDVDHIMERLKIFFDEFDNELMSMTDKKWKHWKKTMKNNIEQRFESTREMYTKFAKEIANRKYRFDSKKEYLKELKKVKLSDIQKYYHKFVLKSKNKKNVIVMKRK